MEDERRYEPVLPECEPLWSRVYDRTYDVLRASGYSIRDAHLCAVRVADVLAFNDWRDVPHPIPDDGYPNGRAA